ncbi:MAG: sodium/solute symporter [Cyclobacteriaceae bacterium]
MSNHRLGFLCRSVVLLTAFVLPFSSFSTDKSQLLDWTELPAIPDPHGFNGVFTGVSADVLIVAGGANFPGDPVWEGGDKQWYDNIFVLEKGSDSWISNETNKLPQPIGYGVSIQTDEGIICIGGNNAQGVSQDVFLMRWNAEGRKVEFEQLPSLPVPLYAMSGDVVDDVIYLVGGHERNGGPATRNFLALDLANRGEGWAWEKKEDFPGEPRIMPVVVGQNDGKVNRLFVFSGRDYDPGKKRPHKLHSDGYSFNPHNGTWNKLTDVPANGTPGIEGGFVGAAPAIQYGGSHILIFGGAGGANQPLYERMDVNDEIKRLEGKLQNPVNSETDSGIDARLDSLYTRQKTLVQKTSFSTKILSYHTITDTWVDMGSYTDKAQVVTKAVTWNDEVVIPMGEIAPGVRTTRVLKGTFRPFDNNFGWLNYTTLACYLALIVGIGLYYSRKNNSTNDFFLGGNRIPWWAAGMSIYATMLSAITYLSQPALAFAFDWQVYLGYFTILAIAPFVVMFYIPYFRKLNITTAYEYLEARFDLTLRMFGSLSFVLFQLARMGIVVYLPALALSTVMGMDIFLAIIIMGILSIVYTVMGGIEAVIWTDVLQVVVLILGLVIGLVYITFELGGDLSHIYEVAMANNKLALVDLRFSWTEVVTWSLLLGSFALNIAPYTTDQTIVQRYMTTKSEKESAKSMWISAWMAIPAGVLIFSMGTFLFVYFKENPELLVVGMETDRIFPLFIANQLPAGIAGLVIAGIFSASMSSLDSSMHSVSTVVTVDFYKRFNEGYTEQGAFAIAKRTTVIIGVLGTLVACLMALYPVQSLFFLFQEILGLAGSSLAGVFILGVFVKRANAIGALVGAVSCIVILAYFKYNTNINFYIYPLIGIPSCVLIGYLTSIFSNQKPKEI